MDDLKKLMLCVLCLVSCIVLCSNSSLMAAAKTPLLIPSPPYTKSQIGTYLSKGWAGYKMKFILSNGRVIRPENNNDTISEEQAFAMLLSVYLNDQATFDKCFEWADQNLSREHADAASYGGTDHLLAWHWIEGIGVQGHDWEAASDADGDYAFALLLAFEKWGKFQYLSKALAVMQDILAKETHAPANLYYEKVLYLKPGVWGEDTLSGYQGIHINPSYFSPYWYRKFNQYLPDERWQMLIDGSYHIIQSIASAIKNPDSSVVFNGVGILPDWAFVDESGNIYFRTGVFNDISSTISSWDAFKAPWRIYFDLRATSGIETRASHYLSQLFTFYQKQLTSNHPIYASYYYSGLPAVNYTSPSASGVPFLSVSLDHTRSIDQQIGHVHFALSYILKSAPTHPLTDATFEGTDIFQDFGNYGYFLVPGDILRSSINTWSLLGLVIAYLTPEI